MTGRFRHTCVTALLILELLVLPVVGWSPNSPWRTQASAVRVRVAAEQGEEMFEDVREIDPQLEVFAIKAKLQEAKQAIRRFNGPHGARLSFECNDDTSWLSAQVALETGVSAFSCRHWKTAASLAPNLYVSNSHRPSLSLSSSVSVFVSVFVCLCLCRCRVRLSNPFLLLTLRPLRQARRSALAHHRGESRVPGAFLRRQKPGDDLSRLTGRGSGPRRSCVQVGNPAREILLLFITGLEYRIARILLQSQ